MPKLTVSTLLLTFSSILFLSSPSLAHNEPIGQSPSADSVVEAGAIEIRIDYSEEPIETPFGQGNLIAVANADTGKQLGPACALVEGQSMFATVNIQDQGTYKVLWRSASDDGHIASGDYLIEVENTTGYTTDRVGNQCFDENGIELKLESQEPLSKEAEASSGLMQVLLWSAPVVLVIAGGGGYLIVRKMRRRKL